jgi:hypothetical protein
MSLAYHFDKSKMPDDEYIPGVPRRSLTQEEYDGLPAHLQATVTAHAAYRKHEPKKPAPAVDVVLQAGDTSISTVEIEQPASAEGEPQQEPPAEGKE